MALENADEENGCVRYIRGSHLKGARPHGKTQTLGFSQGITDYSEKDFASEIPFPAKPGDLLIHHAMTIHRADGNKTNSRTRKALGFIYFGESAKEDTEAKKAYQQKLREAGKTSSEIICCRTIHISSVIIHTATGWYRVGVHWIRVNILSTIVMKW